MGRCDWDDFEPPPKKCGYIPVDSGDDDGGYWWIPPIDGEDPPGPPPPGEEEEEELYGWYCFVRTGCHWMPIGGPGTDDAESGPYENHADCTWNCSELKWYCRYPNTWFAHCYLKFTLLETHDAFLKYDTKALCEAECQTPQPPPRGRWMCNDIDGTCSYDPLAHFWEGYATMAECAAECKYGRWECNVDTGKCYWVFQMRPVHDWQKTKAKCEEYCPKRTPSAPSTPGGNTNVTCTYWHCVDDECKKLTAKQSQYKRELYPQMWTYDAHSDSYWFDCDKVVSYLTSFDITKFATEKKCKERCPVPPRGPITYGGGDPKCNYWKCDMSQDPPVCKEEWASTADYPIEDYAWMWSWDGYRYTFNCPEARPTIAQDNGGHSHPRTCQRNCPPRDPEPPINVEGQDSYWRCDSETGVCSEVFIFTSDYPEEQYPEYWNERGSFLWDIAKADIIESDESNHLTEIGCGDDCPDPVKVFGNVPGQPATETEGSYFKCNRNTWVCDITVWKSSDYPIDLYPQFYDPDTGFFMKDVAEPIIADMNGGDVEKSDCKPKCKPPKPSAPSTETGFGGTPVKCDIWMCDIDRDPKCYRKWFSSRDYPPNNYPGMWDYNPDTETYTFNCAEARSFLADIHGGFTSEGSCNFNCPPLEEPPKSPVTPPPEPTRWVCYPRDGSEGICKPVGITDPDWNIGHPSPTACKAVCNYTSGPPSGESPPARPTSGGGGGGGVSVDDGLYADSEVLDEVLVDGGVSVDSISIDDGGGTSIGDKVFTGSESAAITYYKCNKINTPCDSITVSMLDAKKEYPRDGEDTPAGMWINDTQISPKVYIETKGGHADLTKCQALCVGVVTNIGGGSLVNTGDVGIFTDIIQVDDEDSGGGIDSSDPDAVVIWEPPYDVATSKGLNSEPGWVCNEDSGGCIRMDVPPGVTSYETKEECTYWCATESNGGELLGTYSKRDGDNIND